MSDVPVQAIVAAFDNEKAAEEVLVELKTAQWAGLIGIQDAAVLRRDEKNRLHIKETGDWSGRKGGLFGGAVGAVIGLLAGPGALVVGAAGALIGGLAAKLRDSGFSDERLKRIGESLKPGTSAIIAIVEHKWVAELEREMEEAGADVITEALAVDIAAQLEAGHDVAYTALAAEDIAAIERTVVGEEAVEVESLVATPESVITQAAVVTDKGAIIERVTETAEGVAATAAVVTDAGLVAETVFATEEGIVDGTIVATTEAAEEESEEEEAT